MSDIAERLAEKFGIPIEKAKQIVSRTREDELARNVDTKVRLTELHTFNSRLETPVLYAAKIIIKQWLLDPGLKKREPKIKTR